MQIRDWLNQVNAADIMVADVVTLSRDQPLAVAADVLLRERVTEPGARP